MTKFNEVTLEGKKWLANVDMFHSVESYGARSLIRLIDDESAYFVDNTYEEMKEKLEVVNG